MTSPTFEEFRSSVEVSPEQAQRTGKKAFRLTDEQVEVIRSESPAILVIAGAGSGKTATMSQRIAWHVAAGHVRPDEVLGLTFTRKAAGELAERVNQQLTKLKSSGLVAAPASFNPSETELGNESSLDQIANDAHEETLRPTISTYNSFASGIASAYAMLIGEDPRARLLQDAERWQIMHELVLGLEGTSPDVFEQNTTGSITNNALELSSAIIDNGLTTDQVREFLNTEIAALDQLFGSVKRVKNGGHTEYSSKGGTALKKSPGALRYKLALLDVVDAYFAYKKEHALSEYADQVSWATRIIAELPQVGAELRGQYKLILLDEYQDTSVNQANFLKLAFGGADSVCAVGDPNQAIYSWRGASANALGDFARDFNVQAKDRLTLSSAFRNDRAILDAANALTESLNYGTLNVEKLQPRAGAGDGRVEVIHEHLKSDSHRRLVDRIGEEMSRSRADLGKDLEVAILCRKRSYIGDLVPILEERGIPYEVFGGEAIIEKPEIRLIRALLGLLVTPARNSLVVTLLNFYAIGASDIRALAKMMRQVANQSVSKISGADARNEQNFAETLEWLRRNPEAETGLSAEGRERLLHLAEILHEMRGYRQLSIPQMIERAIDALDLQSYAAARKHGGTRVKNALAAFVRLGHQYTAQNSLANLAGFLAWIDLVEEKEHGAEGESGEDAAIFDSEEVEPESGVVQLMTVHAAKGLEWDVVAVPEMVFKQFDAEKHSVPKWNQSKSLLPYPLRADREHLPSFAASMHVNPESKVDHDTYVDILDKYGQYTQIEVKEHAANEERRLAYVAITRPRNTLLLGSYDFSDEAQVVTTYGKVAEDEDPAKLPQPNTFLTDMHEHIVWTGESGRFEDAGEFLAWAEENGLTSAAALKKSNAEKTPILWPADVDRSLDLRATAADAKAPRSQDVREKIAEWKDTADLLRNESTGVQPSLGLVRDHLTASDVVALSADPYRFLRDQRRPIPQRPSRAARIGNSVHEAIAHYYESPATLDIDSVADPDEMPIDSDGALTQERSQELFARFEASPYSSAPHIAIEQALEVTILDRPVRCVIDAVLDTSYIAGAKPVTIVDWKTGRHPSDAAVESRRLQLALYRLVWSKVHGLDLEDIDAVFYYLGEDDPDRRQLRAEMLTEADIAAHIQGKLDEGEEIYVSSLGS